MVPFHNVESVGLRRVVKLGEVQKIVDYLTDGKCFSHTDWKYRFKENSDKMRTGSLMEVAGVLKSLLQLSQTKPLSFREKKMLERARFLLVTELAMAIHHCTVCPDSPVPFLPGSSIYVIRGSLDPEIGGRYSVLSLVGATCYAELASAYPDSMSLRRHGADHPREHRHRAADDRGSRPRRPERGAAPDRVCDRTRLPRTTRHLPARRYRRLTGRRTPHSPFPVLPTECRDLPDRQRDPNVYRD